MDNKLYYNAEQKQKFLDYIRSTGGSESQYERYKRLFNDISVIEMERNKDISVFKREEILAWYKSENKRYPSIWSYHTLLKKYAIFIQPTVNDFVTISAPDIKEVVVDNKRNLITYIELMDVLEILPNAVDKFLVYGIFCGVKGNLFGELGYSRMQESDPVNLTLWLGAIEENGDIDYKHRKFTADQKLFRYAQEAAEARSYRVVEGSGIVKTYALSLEEGKDIIMKRRSQDIDITNPGRDVKSNRVRQKLKSIFKIAGLDSYTPLDIFWSGFFYQVGLLALQANQVIKNRKELFAINGINKLMKQYDVHTRQIIYAMERYF